MVFLDVNVLLELLIPGRPKQADVEKYLKNQNKELCISMLTVHLVLYFGKKLGLPKASLADFINSYIILDMTAEDYFAAMKLIKGQDYEDALQLSVALRSNCQGIVTLDKDFSNRYKGNIQFITI